MPRTQTLTYEVLEKDGNFEIRSYESFLTATVKESNIVSIMEFNKLFSFISGNNSNKEKIPMTAPVINDMNDNHKTTEFVMPTQFLKNGPPDPLDQDITIRKYEKHFIAAITFSGNIDSEKILKYKNQLIDWLGKNEKKPTSEFF
jgi:hypothetical protein